MSLEITSILSKLFDLFSLKTIEGRITNITNQEQVSQPEKMSILFEILYISSSKLVQFLIDKDNIEVLTKLIDYLKTEIDNNDTYFQSTLIDLLQKILTQLRTGQIISLDDGIIKLLIVLFIINADVLIPRLGNYDIGDNASKSLSTILTDFMDSIGTDTNSGENLQNKITDGIVLNHEFCIYDIIHFIKRFHKTLKLKLPESDNQLFFNDENLKNEQFKNFANHWSGFAACYYCTIDNDDTSIQRPVKKDTTTS